MSFEQLNQLRYYNQEDYLFNDVNQQFHHDGSIGAFDFFSIIIWKANRAKSKIAERLLSRKLTSNQTLELIVRDLTSSIYRMTAPKERLQFLMEEWGFRLPMASAILTILWPDVYTVYDTRVCQMLGDFQYLQNVTQFERIWDGYLGYIDAVRRASPASLSLRDADRYLWAKSAAQDLERDINRWEAEVRKAPIPS